MSGPTDFTLHILGCGSAFPTTRHNPACQVVNHRGTLYMIDCGEGAQAMMRRMRLRFGRLRHIFISHLHGDHMLGLPGLLSTLSMCEIGGTVTVHIMSEGIRLLAPLVDMLCPERSFNLVWNPISPAGGETLVDTGKLRVTTFALYHRVGCCGFRFDTIPPQRPGAVPVAPRSYAYCSDTIRSRAVARAVAGVTTLYHEATYADAEEVHAAPRGHSTARQAAQIAAEAGVGKLIIGHYSKRYETTDTLLEQAREVFPDTFAANEGDVYSI